MAIGICEICGESTEVVGKGNRKGFVIACFECIDIAIADICTDLMNESKQTSEN